MGIVRELLLEEPALSSMKKVLLQIDSPGRETASKRRLRPL